MNHENPQSSLRNREWVRLFIAWAVVGLPLAWGIWQVIIKSLVLFSAGQ